jgi:hypothetical protein
MDQLTQTALDMGLPSLSLNTEAPRTEAIGMYERIGFKEVDGTKGHYAKDLEPGTVTRAVPGDVLRDFFGRAITVSGTLGEGLINRTYLTETWTGDGVVSSVLQRINPAFGPELILDNAAITGRLAELGWTVPRTRLTPGGHLYLRDKEGALWRRMDFIDNDGGVPEHLSEDALRAVGELLGDLHATLRTLDYEPQFTIPHFHDTPHYASRLTALWRQ